MSNKKKNKKLKLNTNYFSLIGAVLFVIVFAVVGVHVILSIHAAALSPSVDITSPSNNSTAYGKSLSIDSTATANNGGSISSVELLVDGSVVKTLTAAPYNFTLNTLSYTDGQHTITVQATDNESDVGSQSITITITNGDINQDGVVNIADLSIMAANWGRTDATYAEGDINQDSVVNLADLSILAANWGESFSLSSGSGSNTGSSTGSSTEGSSTGSNTSGGNCTNPSWSGSNAEDTDSIGSDDVWWVNNDAWSGSAGPQTIYVCNQSSWYVTSDQTNNGGQVETYPDTEYDVGGRANPSTKTIAQYNSITSTFSEAYPAAGSWDAAYDLWTDNWTNETMVWNQWAGTEDYWGDCAEPGTSQNDCVGPGGASADSQAATIDGVAYHFLALGSDCDAANEANCEYIFFRDDQVTSGSVDILAIYQWEVANGYAKSTDVPTQLEYGVEICSTSGTETFPMTGLTFSLN